MKKYIITYFALITFGLSLYAQNDPYLWLEEVDSQRALEFVTEKSDSTFEILSMEPHYTSIYNKSLEILNSKDKIAYPSIRGNYIYNFWRDEDHVRGIWRRSLKADYLKGNPEWDILLDIDELASKDSIKWVFKGASGLYPDYKRFIVSLSKGGGDATVEMEFDAETKTFIENGFYLSEAKGGASFVDQNTLLVSSDFGENTMTSSGYPRQVKLWKRGTDISDAKLIFEGEYEDVSSGGYIVRDGSTQYTFLYRGMTFYTRQMLVWMNDEAIQLDIPEDCDVQGLLNNELILHLKSDWIVDGKTYNQGALVSLNFTDLLKGKKDINLVFQPDEFTSVSGISTTKNKLLVNLLSNVNSKLYIYSFTDGQWESEQIDAPSYGRISVVASDELSDQYFFTYANFLTPSTLFVANASQNTTKPFKSLTAYFDGSKYEVKQLKVKSNDGTIIPYFVVSSKNIKYDGNNPTLLYAYGGFEVSMRPFYSGVIGNAWLENGGIFVLANIRGGGEFGPKWHQDGLKEKRQNVYDDFHAVAEALIDSKITSAKHLGIMGGSNGGLLVGVAFTQRPELYNAVVCQVPLLDMQRYNKLLAGASWMGEYGDPDKPEEWEYIKVYSPYQNLKEGMDYPEVFFYTSTRDDRVHPGHARKMVAKMTDMGYPVYYYENTEGGHAGASTNEQRAKSSALTYAYLLMKLQ